VIYSYENVETTPDEIQDMPRFPILFLEFLKINCNYLEDSSLLGCGAMYMHQKTGIRITCCSPLHRVFLKS
jgi:hypothetical protein